MQSEEKERTQNASDLLVAGWRNGTSGSFLLCTYLGVNSFTSSPDSEPQKLARLWICTVKVCNLDDENSIWTMASKSLVEYLQAAYFVTSPSPPTMFPRTLGLNDINITGMVYAVSPAVAISSSWSSSTRQYQLSRPNIINVKDNPLSNNNTPITYPVTGWRGSTATFNPRANENN